MVEEGEEIVGVSGEETADQYKVAGFTLKKFYCVNCRNGIHSQPNKLRCKTTDCECPCKTHYISRDGIHRIQYGCEDPYTDADIEREGKRDDTDDFITELNDLFNARKK